jgi:PST family polysaccharide transporter
LGWSSCGWFPSRPAFHEKAWTDLQFSGNLTGTNLATYITASADNVIVGLTTGAVSLGLYDRSQRLVVQPLNQMIAPVSRVAVPLLSRLVERPYEYRAAYIRILKALLFISMPAMLVCISNGHIVIETLLGERWLAAAPVFSWICVGGLASAFYSSVYWLLISQGRTRD